MYSTIMKKIFVLFVSLCCLSFTVTAQEAEEETSVVENATETPAEIKDFQNHIIPAFSFQTLQLEQKDFILSPSLNLQYMRIKNPGVVSSQPDSIAIGAGYSMDYFTAGLMSENIRRLHNANVLGSVGFGKNTIACMVPSGSEIPFSSIQSVTGALFYTRQLVKKENVSFLLGGGIIVGDFGFKIKDFPIYVVAIPMFSFNYNNKIFSSTISILGLPSLQLTLFPKSIVRVKGSCGIAGFSSIRDLTFDCALIYYPFKNTKANELVYVAAGVMNKSASTILLDKTKIRYQYYSAYGEISATFITLKGGYNFDGKKYVNSTEAGDMYKGLFASVQAMFMF